jgi:hypothetical protein
MKISFYPESAIDDHVNGLPVNFATKSLAYLSSAQPDVYGKGEDQGVEVAEKILHPRDEYLVNILKGKSRHHLLEQTSGELTLLSE